MSQQALFEKLAGKWEGTCRTWFEPGKLADESPVTGEITEFLDGRFLRHTYTSLDFAESHGANRLRLAR